ncbi:lysophospholipid acyltransferase family protein [Cellulomonas cellasea]|uniref:lysophospholipid acyltransferase family protein n=1 Tax=Cellulomonas cellasea TaxID=43670 RepID=UPI0025A4C809|nr:lysophospholipid acyltransferase family protein [Cellulomonas cellasea]MDM8084051.1 lysophospholipid acyltransferase family protein [Cellulomonas cellasea]
MSGAESVTRPAPQREAAAVPEERQARRGHALGKLFAHVLWNTEVIGAENVPLDGPVLLAANHSGVADGPVLVGASPRPSHVLIKASMFSGPVGAVLRSAGQIPVDGDGRSSLATALGVLRRGGVVGVFPEGSRGRGDMADARAGVAWLAINGAACVVPVAVLGTRRTGEAVSRLPGFRRRLVVEFGEPLSLERAPGTSGRAAVAQANEAIRVAMVALVGAAAERAGLPLPTDDPHRAAPAAH